MLFLLGAAITAQGQLMLDWAHSPDGPGVSTARDVKVDCDGNVYALGFFSGNIDFDPGPGMDTIRAQGLYDLFLQKVNAQGQLVWVKTWNVYDQNMLMDTEPSPRNSLETDCSGHIYIAGTFNAITDFDPGPDSAILIPTIPVEILGHQSYLMKLDSAGNLLWARLYADSTGRFSPGSIALNSQEELIVAGSHGGPYDFDPGPGTLFVTGNLAFGKLDDQGNFVWVKAIGTIQDLSLKRALTLDTEDNLVLFGSFRNAADFDPGPGVYTLGEVTTNYEYNYFLVKLDPDGNLIWAEWLDGTDSAHPLDVTSDSENNILICGRILQSMDFDPKEGVYIVGTPGIVDITGFIARYSPSGHLNWVYELGSYHYRIQTDRFNQVYSTGDSGSSTLDYDPGPGEEFGNGGRNFILCLHPNGDFQWVQTFSTGLKGWGVSLDLDSAGTLYVTGDFFDSNVDFDPGPGQWVLSANWDSYVLKYLQPNLDVAHLPETSSLLYPNPAGAEVNVQVSLGGNSNVHICIQDAQGKILFQQHLENVPVGINTLKISTEDFPTGVYILSLEMESHRFTKKFIRQ